MHVSPPDNLAYQQSLVRAEHKALGDTASAVWQQLLRRSDRFVPLDSAVFLDEEVTSREYGLRYADDVLYDMPALLAVLGIEDPDGIEDTLDVEADVHVTSTGLKLIQGRIGHVLDFPFRVVELHQLVDSLEESPPASSQRRVIDGGRAAPRRQNQQRTWPQPSPRSQALPGASSQPR